jgi:hypothetical protein
MTQTHSHRKAGAGVLRTLLCLGTTLLLCATAFAQTPVYVDAGTGNDGNDGLTPATAKATIQAGVTLVAVGGTVVVAPGTYVENVTINKDLLLQSTGGRAVTTITGISNGALGAILVTSPTTSLQIGGLGAGFTINGVDNPSPGIESAAVYFQGNHSGAQVIDNNVVAAGDAGLMTEFGSTISGFVISSNEFSGVTFTGPNPADNGFANQFTTPNVPRQLVVVSGGSGGGSTSSITFTGNTITGTAGGLNILAQEQGNTLVTIDANIASITGNVFTGTTTRFGTSLRARGPATTISGNIFSSAGLTPTTGHVFIQNTGATAATVAGANTFDKGVYVDGAIATIGVAIQPFLSAVPPTTTIDVLPGTYTGNLTMAISVTLRGAQRGVNACGRLASESIVTGAGTLLTLLTGSAGSVIDGFTFSGGVRGIESTSGPIHNLQILNNRFVGFTGSGIFLNDTGSDITVSRNSVDGASKVGAGDLVHLDTDLFHGFWLVDNCIQAGPTATGFFVDGNHNIGVSGARAPKITGNLITGNLTGMNLGTRAFGFGTISGNTYSGNLFDGLQGGIQNTVISSNTFSSNGRSGLALTSFGNMGADRGGQFTTITGNTFSANVREGLFFSSTQLAGTIATNVANGNNFIGNGTGGTFDGFFYGGTETVDVKCNWWNSLGGPDVSPGNPNPPADDLVGTNALFSPWLDALAPGGLCNQFGPNNVAAVVDSCISITHPCETVDMLFTRLDATPMRGYSVTFQLSANLTLCGSVGASITKGPYLTAAAGVNGTVYQVISNGGGSYTVDEAILGTPCGAVGSGVLFRVRVTNSGGDGTGTITVTSVAARDCNNVPIPGLPGAPTSVTIDTAPTAAITDLSAAQLLTGNDVDGTTKIQITFTAPPAMAQVKVYRAGFGNYPEYDDAPSAGSVPATPSYPPGAPWALTGITASGQFDEVANRDFWYFVAFAVDSCGNVSPVSNKTTGTLNYHLGDVSTGFVTCAGNNKVFTEDISFLGANYAILLGVSDPLACLDVGPTTTNFVDGRPLTDNRVQFEDLILFAINYNEVSKTLPVLVPASRDELTLLVPAASERGDEFAARVWATGSGRIQGLSIQLAWNPAAVEPVGVEPGEWLNSLGGVAFSSGPGGVDAALLGSRTVGLAGEGAVAQVRFRVVGAGDPAIRIATVDARDARNRRVDLQAERNDDGAAALPRVTQLLPNIPNPFNPSTRIVFTVATAGRVEVDVLTVAGRRLRSLLHDVRTAGLHEVIWDGNDDSGTRAASGIYYVRLRSAGTTAQRPIVMVK